MSLPEMNTWIKENQKTATPEDSAFIEQIKQACKGDEKSMRFICEWMYKPNPKPIQIKGDLNVKHQVKKIDLNLTNNTPHGPGNSKS